MRTLLALTPLFLFWLWPSNSVRRLYVGVPVESSVLMCTAVDLATAGFWRDPRDPKSGEVYQESRLAKESPSRWRVQLNGNRADVTVVSPSRAIAPAHFTVERTSGGFLLVSEREPGVSPETITIDSGNSSFVYVDQHVNPLWNRANVYVGSCVPSM